MEDNSLLKEFIEATGLPLEFAVRLIAQLMVKNNIDPHTVTVEDFRKMAENYLLEAFKDIPAQGRP